MLLKTTLTTLLLLSSVSVTSNENTGAVQITDFENWNGSEALLVRTNQTTKTNPANCNLTGRYYLPDTASDISRSMILSAFLANQEVKFTIYSGGCSSNDNDSKATIVSVTLAH